MHLATTSPARKAAPGVGVGGAKNRVWDFFEDGVKRAWKIDPQVVETYLETTTPKTTTALGVPHWPSRDPIGELGGLNLYGFVGNDGVNRWDFFCLEGANPFGLFYPGHDSDFPLLDDPFNLRNGLPLPPSGPEADNDYSDCTVIRTEEYWEELRRTRWYIGPYDWDPGQTFVITFVLGSPIG